MPPTPHLAKQAGSQTKSGMMCGRFIDTRGQALRPFLPAHPGLVEASGGGHRRLAETRSDADITRFRTEFSHRSARVAMTSVTSTDHS